VARQVARRLTVKAASRLRRKDMYAKMFQLSVRTGDDERWSGAVKLPPAQDNFSFLEALDRLWLGMTAEMRPTKLKKISMVMSDLVRQGEITPDLFDFNAPEKQRAQAKFDALTGVMDGINRKFGAESIQLGVSPRTSAGFVGTKIAFSRVPDIEEFSE
jgi:DNA polymerase-4